MCLLSTLVDLGEHEHMSCSTLQFKTWYDLLVEELQEVVKHGKLQKSKDTATQAMTVFQVEKKSFHYVQAPGMLRSDLE